MSAAALTFDPTFTFGPRSSFTWPGPLDSANDGLLAQDLTSIASSSEASLTPPSAPRSLTSSPPRSSFTPEQQELKHQRDRARRDAKLMARMQRSTSQATYVDSPPMLPDVTSAMDIPSYSAASGSLPLLSEEVSSLSGSPYLSSYSPPLPEHVPNAPVFPTPYGSMQASLNMPMSYSGSYATPSQYSSPRSSTMPLPADTGIMYQMPAVMPSGGASAQDGGHVRVVQSRPKPRCWEHGCNGRQFSTFSNLMRHQREKSGQAAKASCPNCGAEFTRTTARNGHLLHDKCKQRKLS